MSILKFVRQIFTDNEEFEEVDDYEEEEEEEEQDVVAEDGRSTNVTARQPPETGKIDRWWEREPSPLAPVLVIPGLDNNMTIGKILSQVRNNKGATIEIPDNLMTILNLLNKGDFDYKEIVDLILKIQSLTGEVIRSANSSAYSNGVKINRIREALTRLGPQKVKGILYLYGCRSTTCEDERVVSLAESITQHCYAVGQIASYLSLRYFPDPDSAFLAGLLHDVGKLSLLREIETIIEFPDSLETFTEEMFSPIFPPFHELAGGLIAKEWNLSHDIGFCIRMHHQPNNFLFANDANEDDTPRMLAALIHVSDIIAGQLGYGCSVVQEGGIFANVAMEMLGIVDEPETHLFLAEIPQMLQASMPPSKEEED